MTGLTLRLFGSPEVRHDGEEVEGFRSAKARALLFYVVVSEIPQARTKLAGLLWGELPEENANANLRKTLTNLRKVADPYLTITRDTVAVDENNPPWLDVHEFKMALDSRDFERLEAAVDLYRGEFLDGFYLHEAREFESWQLDERYRLRERMLAALNRLAEGYAERGQFSKAIRSAQRLLTMEPLREDAHRLLMALYARNGQPARALRQFETCVQLLETELGVAPDLQTRRLVEAIRAGEFVPESPLWTGDQEPHVASHIGQGPDAFDDQRPGNEGAQGLFIGREQELAHLDEALSEVLAARGRLVFVTGEAGRGKSALLAEFARRAPNREPHLIVALGTCNAFSGAGDPFHPFREILTSLGKQVDRISQKRSERVQLQSQFADILTAVARQHPLLLLLDDLQWADNSSLNLLFHLSRRLSSLPILVLGAYRASDAALARATAPLPSLFAELKRRLEVSEIDLERLSPHVRREFVDALIDSEPNHLAESFRVTFYRHTQGHALFSIELLREMQARGDLFRDEQGFWNAALELDWERLPARVEAVIAQRIGRLDDALREMLSVASVEGETFTAQVVARVLQREEREVLRQLARVQKEHRLVREIGEVKLAGRSLTRYSFGHALFRQYLYQELSQGQRRLLHGDVAASLESLYDGHAGTVLAQLANHFAEAQDSKKAIHYLVAAGDQARLQNAYQEAVEHYKRALSLLKGTGDYEEAARTQMKLGLTYHNASAFEQARAANEEAFRLWQQVGLRQLPGRPRRAPHALRIAAENPSGKLDPAMVKETPRSLLIQQLFSGLLQLGPDQDLLPDLARGWEVLDRGRRYLFHLRPNASWTDGVVVTAGDFEFAWKRVLDPATASPNASDLFDVKGARSFHLGNGSPDEVGIRALDDLTLQVELEGVRPYFPNMLYVDWAKAVPRHAVEKHGPAWVEPENLVTSGPFCLVSWEPGERFVLARNRDYHRPFSGNVERVEIHLGLGEDRLRHLDMYLAGELDVLYTFSHLPPQTQQKMREDLVGEYRSTPALATCFVGFVHSQPPFDDRRVRQALSMATDRRTLAGVIRHGHVTPATGGFLSPVHAAYSEGIALPYDPDRARRLLAEAGHERGQGLPTITMVNGHASLSVEADLRYLQAQWRDELGVDMEWETVWNMGEFLSRLTNDPPHLFYVRWAGKYADPDDFLLLESAIIWELSRWHNQRYFALLHEARELSDWRERMELYRRADRMLVEEAAVLPLSYDQTQFLVKPWVKRFTSVASPGWFLPQVILEPHGQEE